MHTLPTPEGQDPAEEGRRCVEGQDPDEGRRAEEEVILFPCPRLVEGTDL